MPGERLNAIESGGEDLRLIGHTIAVGVRDDDDRITRRVQLGIAVLRPHADQQPALGIEHGCRTSGSVANNFTSNSAGTVGSAMRGLASSAMAWPFQVQAVSRQQPRSIGTPSPIRLLPLA